MAGSWRKSLSKNLRMRKSTHSNVTSMSVCILKTVSNVDFLDLLLPGVDVRSLLYDAVFFHAVALWLQVAG